MPPDLHQLLKRAANGGDPRGLPATFGALLRVPQDYRQYTVAQRATAIWVLARTGESRAVPILLASLASRSPEIRGAAARGLGELGILKPGVVESLIKRLRRDSEAPVREAAAYALGLLGDRAALSPLLQTVANRKEVERVRTMATEAVVDLAASSAIIELERILVSVGSHSALENEIRSAILRLKELP